jgi:hypothetical protein
MPLIEIVQNKGLPITGGPLFCGGSLKGNILALTKINQGFAMHQIFWAYARLDLHQQKQKKKTFNSFQSRFFYENFYFSNVDAVGGYSEPGPGRRWYIIPQFYNGYTWLAGCILQAICR